MPPAGFEPTSQAFSDELEKPVCLAGLHYGGMENEKNATARI